MRYEKPSIEMIILDTDDVVRTSPLEEDENQEIVIPGIPGMST